LTTEIFSFPATTDTTCIQPGQTIPTAIIPGLTPKIATASTCVVVSLPQQIGTITHSSGAYPDTTLAALTVQAFTNSAMTIATCYNPGETIAALIVPTTKEGIKCSTTVFPEATEIQTYPFYVTGAFSTETSTSIIPGYTNIQCDVLPDYENMETCNTIKPLSWALLVITFISIQMVDIRHTSPLGERGRASCLPRFYFLGVPKKPRCWQCRTHFRTPWIRLITICAHLLPRNETTIRPARMEDVETLDVHRNRFVNSRHYHHHLVPSLHSSTN